MRVRKRRQQYNCLPPFRAQAAFEQSSHFYYCCLVACGMLFRLFVSLFLSFRVKTKKKYLPIFVTRVTRYSHALAVTCIPRAYTQSHYTKRTMCSLYSRNENKTEKNIYNIKHHISFTISDENEPKIRPLKIHVQNVARS